MKSRTGFILLINGCPFVWESKKQAVVAQSSAEAEYIALSSCVRQVLWAISLLKQLFNYESVVVIYTDNLPAKNVAEGSNGSKLTRHIYIKHHFIKEILADDENLVRLQYCESANMMADFLTKTLTGSNFTKWKNIVGNKNDQFKGSV
eukprot:Awhi_evm1s2661